MKNVCRMPIKHSTANMKYYIVYYTCASSGDGVVRVSAFTDYSVDADEKLLGIPLICEQGDMVKAPSEGYLRFVIPPEGMLQQNMGFCLVAENDVETPPEFTVCEILIDNDFRKPLFLSLDHLRGFGMPFPVNRAEFLHTEVSKEEGTVKFDIDNTDEHGYLLLYSGLGDTEVFDKAGCSLFVAKNNYCIDEPIVFTYRNLYVKYEPSIFMIDVLMYYEGDRPGIDCSRDYITLLYKQLRRGINNTFSMPNEGAREYYNRFTGNYRLRMMQVYQDLCPMQEFTITEEHRQDELKEPPAGMMYFISTKRLPSKLVIHSENPDRLSAIFFRCDSPMVDLMEQSLFYIRDGAHNIHILGNLQSVPERMLYSTVYQILFTAYNKRISEIRESSWINSTPLISDAIAAFINHNLSKKLTIKELTEVFHMSESNLSHTFKSQKGINVQRFIYNAKINRAKQWLAETDYPVTEIASLLNYSDIHSFSHSFSQLVGMSPLEYRNMIKAHGGREESDSKSV